MKCRRLAKDKCPADWGAFSPLEGKGLFSNKAFDEHKRRRLAPLEALHADAGNLDVPSSTDEAAFSLAEEDGAACDSLTQTCASTDGQQHLPSLRLSGWMELLSNDVGFFLAELLRAATSPFSSSPRDWLLDEEVVSAGTKAPFAGRFPLAPGVTERNLKSTKQPQPRPLAAKAKAEAEAEDDTQGGACLTDVTSSGLGNGVQETLPMVSPPGVAFVSWLLEEGLPFASIVKADSTGKF